MDFLNQAMFYLLSQFQAFTGSYGWAIILLTVFIRVVLWPLNSAQTRSMKTMQEMQPKLKALQERHKADPQKLQEAMMKFYAENKFNPFSGCLPLIVQIPIFISLYGCLNSPQFLAAAGNENFFFIDKLYNTLQGYAGVPFDHEFAVQSNDHFVADNKATIVFKDPAKPPMEIAVPDANNILISHPKPLIPGDPVIFEIPFDKLGLSSDYNTSAQYVKVSVINQASRELEAIEMKPEAGILRDQMKTVKGVPAFHMDVLVLLGLYALMMYLYQQVMQKMSPASAQTEGMQGQMMKMMPIMFVVMMFFIPIPAGVMVYLVVTTLLMFVQTLWVNFSENKKKNNDGGTKPPSDRVIDIKPDQA